MHERETNMQLKMIIKLVQNKMKIESQYAKS